MQPLWRTIPQAVKEIKARDPDTAITEYMLRKAVKEKKIRSMQPSRKIFIDMNEIGGRNENRT